MNSSKMKNPILLLTLLSSSLFAEITVVSPKKASFLENLSALEIRRYIYLRMGTAVAIPAEELPKTGDVIVIAQKDHSIVKDVCDEATKVAVAALEPEQYIAKTMAMPGVEGRKVLLIAGGDAVGAMYGTYRVCEKMGVRFYLHGDVIPETKIPLALLEVNETGKPLFSIRGINPFHDFPEGPDWWNQDDYKNYISQLAKMRMNFIGLHCYPERYGPEPLVWIGPKEYLDKKNNPTSSFPSQWANTKSGGWAWGYSAMKTTDFTGGADLLFDGDDYGPDIMAGMMPRPETPEACNQLFEKSGEMFKQAFGYAKKLGVKTCVGTETPLQIPSQMRNKLKADGKDAASLDVIRDVYRGMFTRINQVYPVDYYWLWTPEDWTWSGNKPEQLDATVKDIKAALEALAGLGNPFTLATCGWVLGPQNDRAALDKVLPKAVPMSCINRGVGHEAVERGFADITGRPKWAIPWMENDPNMIAPQPWVGRMRYDAADSLRFGCTGLIGIHWRTKAMSQNVSALAGAAWDQSWVPSDFDTTPVVPAKAENKPAAVGAVGGSEANEQNAAPVDIKRARAMPGRARAMPVEDFYVDFARASFGDAVAEPAGKLLAKIDGTKLVETSAWIDGPGGITPNTTAWADEKAKYAFVEELAYLRPQVTGPANLERFDYWLNTYRCQAVMGEIGCMRGELDKAAGAIKAEKDAAKKKELAAKVLPVRVEMARKWEKMMSFQVAAVDTPGELGTINTIERHNRTQQKFMSKHDKELEEALGEKLPAAIEPGKAYDGPARIIVPTVRTHITEGEGITLKIILLDKQPMKGAALFFRVMGKGEYVKFDLNHLGRAVWQAKLLPAMEDFEYYVEAERADGTKMCWPATAPAVGQTVVVCGKLNGSF